jgi:hypothetical protein
MEFKNHTCFRHQNFIFLQKNKPIGLQKIIQAFELKENINLHAIWQSGLKTSPKLQYIETSANFNLKLYIFLHTLASGTLLFLSPMILLRRLLHAISAE